VLCAGEENEETSVYKGQLVNDRIQLDHQEILFEAELYFCKLEGERLFALQVEDEDGHLRYIEYDLSVNPALKVKQWCFFESFDWTRIFDEHREYVWKGNKLYASYDFFGYCSIFVFDAKTLTWSKPKFIGTGTIKKLMIDEEDVLTISTVENSGENSIEPLMTKVVYRLPMRKPDKLRYIAWFKIRREAIFFGSSLYERLAPRLPYNSEFREFSENY